jgi:hypothetical protein
MREYYNITIRKDLNNQLLSHLLRADGQEDLCFATYIPSTGRIKRSGIISEILFPEEGDHNVHGTVGFNTQYFERVLHYAAQKKVGLVLLHSHPYPGWQDMSRIDKRSEQSIAGTVKAITKLPFIGMTVGSDGNWSARFWILNTERKFEHQWCESVRIIDKDLSIQFNDNLSVPQINSKRQLRTISAWGEKFQKDLSRIRVGIVGLGSVGSIVAEILARTGISNFTLIDFDSIEEKNLDRTLGTYEDDIGKSKVSVVRQSILRSRTAPNVTIETIDYSVCEEKGFLSAIDCDLLFSCVDRPWPRHNLNLISYSHLIPVIDGGILVQTNKVNSKILGADWKVNTIGYKRACMLCVGQYKIENAVLERDGKFEDPKYIEGLKDKSIIDSHENVFAFSCNAASLEVLQMLTLILAPGKISDVGQQFYHFTSGELDKNYKQCIENCFFPSVMGRGDRSGVIPYSSHPKAEQMREKRSQI